MPEGAARGSSYQYLKADSVFQANFKTKTHPFQKVSVSNTIGDNREAHPPHTDMQGSSDHCESPP